MNDKILYKQLTMALERFQTKRTVNKCLHVFDNQNKVSINKLQYLYRNINILVQLYSCWYKDRNSCWNSELWIQFFYEKLLNKLITCHNNKPLEYDGIVRIRGRDPMAKVPKQKEKFLKKGLIKLENWDHTEQLFVLKYQTIIIKKFGIKGAI